MIYVALRERKTPSTFAVWQKLSSKGEDMIMTYHYFGN
jgi:hypothetical protein